MAYMTSSKTPKASQAFDQMQRAWTLLKATYAAATDCQSTGKLPPASRPTHWLVPALRQA